MVDARGDVRQSSSARLIVDQRSKLGNGDRDLNSEHLEEVETARWNDSRLDVTIDFCRLTSE